MFFVKAGSAQIPALGFGTWELKPEDAYRMVGHALKVGYRHIDTAQIYENEEAVGAAIADSGVARGEIFLTTKVWVKRFRAGDLQRSVEESLQKLKVDQVDLLLLHWPNRGVPLAETLGALVETHAKGMTAHIGVSNYNVALMKEAEAHLAKIKGAPKLAINQVEYHPYLNQAPVLKAVRAEGMGLTAYSPLARGNVVGDETLKRIGERHGKSAPQVGLRWLVQQEGVIAIPRSSSEAHCGSNFEIFDFKLNAQEMDAVSALARPDGRYVDPESLAPEWDT